jgi:DNA-directed RNA polymerase specialized sigma24 family protein
MDDSRFANVDFDALLSRLFAAAQALFARQGLKGNASILPGTGKSAEDLVLDTVQEFIRGKNVEWRPKSTDEDPFPLLLVVMRRDFLDLVKKGRAHKRTKVVDSLEEEENRGSIEQEVVDTEEIFSQAEGDDLTKERVYSLVAGDKELEEYIEAILELDLIRKPKELAEFLGITSDQVRLRQRRVRTKLAGWHRSVMVKHQRKCS